MKIEFSDNRGVIEYVYNAAGAKLQKKVTENGITKTTDYAEGRIVRGLEPDTHHQHIIGL